MAIETAIVLVSNLYEPKGLGFGHRVDTGEAVFIPPKLLNYNPMDMGDEVEMKLIPNVGPHIEKNPWRAVCVVDGDNDRDQVTPGSEIPDIVSDPWGRAVFEDEVMIMEDPVREKVSPQEPPEVELEDRIKAVLSDGSPRDATMIIEDLDLAPEKDPHGNPYSYLHKTLARLHHNGEIAAAKLYASGKQLKASGLVYAAELKDLRIYLTEAWIDG